MADGSALHLVDTTMFWSPTGGGVRRYLETKRAWLLRRPGWRHTIAVPGVSTPAAQRGRADRSATVCDRVAIPSLPLPGSGGYRLPVLRRRAARLLADLAPDVIEAGDPYRLAWAAQDAAQRCGVPAVAYCHTNLEAMARLVGGPPLAFAARAYARRVYRGFDRVFVPSAAMREQVAAWGIEHAALRPLGVDTSTFHLDRASSAWRSTNGYAAPTRLLVYAGRLAPEKHLDVLAAAVDRLGPPYRLLVVGAGPRPPRGARVDVRPFVADVGELATVLASADAFVHAGDQETFGLSALEAMACGTPVVARARAGLAELVDESVGVAVDAATPEAFAEAIDALFDRDLDALGAAARRRAERYGWDEALAGLEAEYRAVVSGARLVRSGRIDETSPPRLPQAEGATRVEKGACR